MPFCRDAVGKKPYLHKCPGYDRKPSNGEASVLELWKMSTPSLPLFQGPLYTRVVTLAGSYL